MSWVRLDYEGTIGRLIELVGRDVLVELRIDSEEGEPRISTIGRLLGAPPRQSEESAHSPAGQEHLVFDLDSGGTFTLFEGQFVAGEWLEEDTRRLTITMRDSEMRVIELGGRVPSELEEDVLL